MKQFKLPSKIKELIIGKEFNMRNAMEKYMKILTRIYYLKN